MRFETKLTVTLLSVEHNWQLSLSSRSTKSKSNSSTPGHKHIYKWNVKAITLDAIDDKATMYFFFFFYEQFNKTSVQELYKNRKKLLYLNAFHS